MTSNQLVLIEQNQKSFNINLFQPIKNYVRIRYTNFAINSKYLICGASSGGLYLFSRTDGDLKFLSTIPGNNGKISSIVFSKNNLDLFAFGTKRGVFKLILLKLTSDNLDKQQWQEIYSAKAFTKHSISLIEFQDDNLNEFKLFLADDAFNIYMISKMKTFSSIFKNEPPVRILNLDFPIHQLEADNQYLLVTAEDKTSIFNMEKLTLNKIGTRSRPNGVFGSCFYGRNQSENEAELKFVFTARPSLRLWQANQEGSVICTHQFKDYLNKNNCNFIYQFKQDQLDQESIRLCLNGSKTKTQLTNSNFNQIYKLQIKEFIYLVTFTNVPKTMLFIINPLNAQIVFWTDQITNPITKIMISEDELIICHKNESIHDENRKETEEERLFSLIKIYNLDDFLDDNHLLNLSNLSLFCFLKENESIGANLVKENPDLKAYLHDEWSKLDDNQRSMFDHLENLFHSDESNGVENANGVHSVEFNLDGLNKNNEKILNGLSNGKQSINGFASKSSSEGKVNELSSILSKIAKSTESIELIKPSNLLNGKFKKSIEELTSKHRWKNELNDEKRSLKKKLKKLKQNLDKQQLDKLKCECNYPSPRSHLILNSKQKAMRLILIKLLDDNNIDEIMDVCFEYAIWDLYLDLLILKSRFTDYIKMSLLLMDINLLARNNVFIKKFKNDLELSKELFRLFVEQKNLDVNENDEQATNRTICLNCKMNLNLDYIRWQDIIDFLYKTLKLDDLLDLLMIHHQQLPYSVLNTKLCIHLLQTEMIKQYESSLTNDKLTKLNKHLTTRSLKKSKSGVDQDNWSMYLDLSKKDCDICKSPLRGCREPLLVFKCNHIYHKECEESSNLTTKRTCYVCMNSK